jgi:hypothetical protein
MGVGVRVSVRVGVRFFLKYLKLSEAIRSYLKLS